MRTCDYVKRYWGKSRMQCSWDGKERVVYLQNNGRAYCYVMKNLDRKFIIGKYHLFGDTMIFTPLRESEKKQSKSESFHPIKF